MGLKSKGASGLSYVVTCSLPCVRWHEGVDCVKKKEEKVHAHAFAIRPNGEWRQENRNSCVNQRNRSKSQENQINLLTKTAWLGLDDNTLRAPFHPPSHGLIVSGGWQEHRKRHSSWMEHTEKGLCVRVCRADHKTPSQMQEDKQGRQKKKKKKRKKEKKQEREER